MTKLFDCLESMGEDKELYCTTQLEDIFMIVQRDMTIVDTTVFLVLRLLRDPLVLTFPTTT